MLKKGIAFLSDRARPRQFKYSILKEKKSIMLKAVHPLPMAVVMFGKMVLVIWHCMM